MLVATLFVLGQVAGAGGWTGARPTECAPLASATSSNVWERAKHSSLRRYCDLLASGAAKLASGPAPDDAREAIANADDAARALPGHAAPAVLRGRALVVLGQWHEAVAALEGAMAEDSHALDDPSALFAWARALGRVGRAADAEAAFHLLLPRVSGLSPAERGRAELEAALLAEGRGQAGLDDAIALLRQASRDAQDSLLAVSVMALSLALDRAGEREESRIALDTGAGKRDPREVAADQRAQDALADVGALGEADALVAVALGERDPRAARELWTTYLAGAGVKGPWADHARAHVLSSPRARGGRGR
ncbi:MAG: hypothetical protein ACLQVI_12495 [Polyangiaceae bacterium]